MRPGQRAPLSTSARRTSRSPSSRRFRPPTATPTTWSRLKLVGRESSRLALRFEGRTLSHLRLEFVTIAREPPPAPLTREEATGRTSYTFVFYTMVRASEPARAGASATIWVE
jgi:hypothetical protein